MEAQDGARHPCIIPAPRADLRNDRSAGMLQRTAVLAAAVTRLDGLNLNEL